MAEATGEKLHPFIKDPDAILDYAVSWAAWLAEVSDTLLISTWSILENPGDALVVETDVSNNTVATIWLSGGTVGMKYALLNRVTTAGGRTNDRTIYVKIREL